MLVGNELISAVPAIANENDVVKSVVAVVGGDAFEPHDRMAFGACGKLHAQY
jgi:hypothetical protein